MKKKFVVSKSVYEFALKYQALRGEYQALFLKRLSPFRQLQTNSRTSLPSSASWS